MKSVYWSKAISILLIAGIFLTSIPLDVSAELGNAENISQNQKTKLPDLTKRITPENYTPEVWELVEPTVTPEEHKLLKAAKVKRSKALQKFKNRSRQIRPNPAHHILRLNQQMNQLVAVSIVQTALRD